jgi:hypothetical protein
MEGVGICYGRSEYFAAICYSSWPFYIYCVNLVYFSHFGMLYQDKSGIPDRNLNFYG